MLICISICGCVHDSQCVALLVSVFVTVLLKAWCIMQHGSSFLSSHWVSINIQYCCLFCRLAHTLALCCCCYKCSSNSSSTSEHYRISETNNLELFNTRKKISPSFSTRKAGLIKLHIYGLSQTHYHRLLSVEFPRTFYKFHLIFTRHKCPQKHTHAHIHALTEQRIKSKAHTRVGLVNIRLRENPSSTSASANSQQDL